jgi:orotate phosphoribosyltransferase
MSLKDPNIRTKESLIEVVKEKALQFGDFTLKSGEKSDFYLDCRKLSLSSEGLDLIVQNMHVILRMSSVGREFGSYEFDAIGGPCVGADPIVGAFLYNQGRVKTPLRGFLVRKEDDERGGHIIGSVEKEDKVVVVEDVTTTGNTLMRTIDVIEDFGCQVIYALSIIDRLSGAKELFAKKGIEFGSILTIDDIAEKTYKKID